jgi:UDP-glucose 4-epimerase
VARANVLALESDAPSGAYNVGTGIETSVNELYEILRDTSGRDLPPAHGGAKPGEQLRSSVDPTAGASILGWRPETDLATGLKRTLSFFEAL